MLQSYFKSTDNRVTDEQHKKIVAMNAALEVLKASASAQTAWAGSDKVQHDLQHAAQEVASLANAIRTYMDAK
ncbi:MULTISPECIES: hypothetical protein [Serratia]|jgi:hypothetical protein|uniref:hypothetical protein n=1 Tax=Serratia TaxID=613 RepID=UPI0021C62ADF|nr:hypothetical protein [Serratia liquefaciens]